MKDLLVHRILVVDDEAHYRFLIQQFLEKLGYPCETAESAREALEKLREKRFDLVISDICMTETDGLELARQAKHEFPYLDFIVMTGHTADYSYSDIIEAGSSDFIGKPFSTAELKAKLERIERERRVLQSLRETNRALLWQSSVNSSLAELSKMIITSMNLDHVSNLVLKHAKQLTGSTFGSIAYRNNIGDLVRCSSGTLDEDDLRDEEVLLKKFRPQWEKGIACKKAIMTGAQGAGHSTAEEPDAMERAYRYLSVPALNDNLLLGQLALAKTESDYEEKDLTIARRLAVVYALAIQRKLADSELKQTQTKLRSMLEKTVNALTSALELRDPYTAGHQNRVALLAAAIASEMGMSGPEVSMVRMAGLIHDIGKIYVPSELLSKPTKLKEVEMNLIRHHPVAGRDILKNVDLPYPIAEVVFQHHERMDGSGYPLGLSGRDILPESRIMAVADVYEAMISHRPYRPSLGQKCAIEELSKNSGVLYDPNVVDTCLELLLNKGFEFDTSVN
ncbi:MAG: HD domain-containing phosphohydrolase [Syntrophobacteraceae bacterium]